MTCSGPEEHRKIGVFGGTFDPVHEGHIRLAEFVLDQGIVDLILFLPAASPPHKPGAGAPFPHRLALLETAIDRRPAMAVSTLESRRQGPSYTVDSLRALHREYPDARLFFLLGADSLLELHLWYRYVEIFDLADLIVVARSGLPDSVCHEAIKKFPGGFSPDSSGRVWRRDNGAVIWYLSGFSFPVSSSDIRRRLAAGQRPSGLNPEVLAYIKKHRLYTASEGEHAVHC